MQKCENWESTGKISESTHEKSNLIFSHFSNTPGIGPLHTSGTPGYIELAVFVLTKNKMVSLKIPVDNNRWIVS